jgi:hypothetical protein
MTYPIFSGAGMYLYNPEPGMDMHEYVQRFKDAGGTWIGFLLQEGTVRINNPKNDQLIQICKEKGIVAVGSSWMDDKPVEEAKIAKEICVEKDLAAWIPNGEQPICYSQPWGFCADCFGRSSKWMGEWGMMRPTMFSSFSRFRNHDIDYKPFVQAGCFAGPQCYTNALGQFFGPDEGVVDAYDVNQPHNGYRGFNADKIAPTMGIAIGQGFPVDIDDWMADLANVREQYPGDGFSFWPGELFKNVPNGWARLEYWIKQRGLARYPGDAPTQEPALTAIQLPYTGPYYGPTADKPKRKGNTAKALKMAMHQGGFGTFVVPDLYYNLNLEIAVRRFQNSVGISPASGNYGKGTWEAIRKARLPNGKLMIPEAARELIRIEARS